VHRIREWRWSTIVRVNISNIERCAKHEIQRTKTHTLLLICHGPQHASLPQLSRTSCRTQFLRTPYPLATKRSLSTPSGNQTETFLFSRGRTASTLPSYHPCRRPLPRVYQTLTWSPTCRFRQAWLSHTCATSKSVVVWWHASDWWVVERALGLGKRIVRRTCTSSSHVLQLYL
jgi:hypothetical protein